MGNWESELELWLKLNKHYYKLINLNSLKIEHSKLLIKDLVSYHDEFKSLSELKEKHNTVISKENRTYYENKQAKKLLITIINYDKLPYLEKELKKFNAQMLVCDESHNLKNFKGKQSKIVERLSRTTDYRVLMTGTPIIQGPQDLFMQYKILGLETFNTNWYEFSNKWLKFGGFNSKQIIGYRNGGSIKRRLRETMYRVKLKDVVDLPNITLKNTLVDLSPEARKYYNELQKEMITTIEREPKLSKTKLKTLLDDCGVYYEENESWESLVYKAEPFLNSTTCELVVTQLIRLQQIAGGFITLDTGEILQVCDKKLKATVNEVVKRKTPTIIFCRFIPEIEALEKMIAKKKKVCVMRGKNSQRVYKDFREGKYDVMILQIQSGSVGLNLQRADGIIFHSWDYSAGNYIQAIARIRRKGQDNEMEIIHIKAKNTVDVKILVALDKKLSISNKLLDN